LPGVSGIITLNCVFHPVRTIWHSAATYNKTSRHLQTFHSSGRGQLVGSPQLTSTLLLGTFLVDELNAKHHLLDLLQSFTATDVPSSKLVSPHKVAESRYF
jgi:hypothetical protein